MQYYSSTNRFSTRSHLGSIQLLRKELVGSCRVDLAAAHLHHLPHEETLHLLLSIFELLQLCWVLVNHLRQHLSVSDEISFARHYWGAYINIPDLS